MITYRIVVLLYKWHWNFGPKRWSHYFWNEQEIISTSPEWSSSSPAPSRRSPRAAATSAKEGYGRHRCRGRAAFQTAAQHAGFRRRQPVSPSHSVHMRSYGYHAAAAAGGSTGRDRRRHRRRARPRRWAWAWAWGPCACGAAGAGRAGRHGDAGRAPGPPRQGGCAAPLVPLRREVILVGVGDRATTPVGDGPFLHGWISLGERGGVPAAAAVRSLLVVAACVRLETQLDFLPFLVCTHGDFHYS